jgi:predicted metal-dependent peptidase
MSLHLPFVAAVAMTMVPKIEKCGTACTNGVWIKFDPDFCASQSDQELMYLYAHEALHKAFLSPWRRGVRQPALWNMAEDYVINNALNDMQSSMLKMPRNGLTNVRYRGMSGEKVYEQLLKDLQRAPANFQIDIIEDGEKTLADAEIEVTNIAKACKMAGISAGLIDLILGNAGVSQVKWQDVLREFVTAHVKSGTTWRRRSRRSEEIYLPTLRSKVMRSIVVFGDFSGSMMHVVKEVLSEIQGIVDDVSPEIVHVICGDTRVTFNRTFNRGEKLVIETRGGGGTDFRPLFTAAEQLESPPDCGVFLTDTYGTFPEAPPMYPLIWGVLGAQGVHVPWGEVVQVGK